MSFRCATLSECAPQVSGSMNIAGRREWSVVNVRNEIHTAAREKTSPGGPTVTPRHMKGKISYFLCFFLGCGHIRCNESFVKLLKSV